jgi:hypothetical protein
VATVTDPLEEMKVPTKQARIVDASGYPDGHALKKLKKPKIAELPSADDVQTDTKEGLLEVNENLGLPSDLENQASKIVVGTIDNVAQMAAAPGNLLGEISNKTIGNVENPPNMTSVMTSLIIESLGTLDSLNAPISPGKSGMEIELEIVEVKGKIVVGSSDKVVIPPEAAKRPAGKLEKLSTALESPTNALETVRDLVASVETKSGSSNDAGESLGSSDVNPPALDNLGKN